MSSPSRNTRPLIESGTLISPIALPLRPVIYEVNTWLWLRELSRQYDQSITLETVPDAEWDALAAMGFHAVWLMGVWERSPAGLAMALRDDKLRRDFLAALSDLAVEDIVGSPYCVRQYVVDGILGGPDGLAVARSALAKRGLGLILDFVPNHVAPDHPWIFSHPERFIQGEPNELDQTPPAFFRAGDSIIANGRDPRHSPWPDVAQLNAFDPGLRAMTIETLRDIATQCDGVRCDMAMLLITDVFRGTWGERAGPSPAQEFWLEIIPAVRADYPAFRFIAEVYWGMQPALIAQGFDYCYDKVLYDRLVLDDAASIRRHLAADPAYQDHLVRFIENHDEPRAAQIFTGERARAAAVIAHTLPGAKLLHQGQLDGCSVRLPVFLGRRPVEAADGSLRAFYQWLLAALGNPALRDGHWRLCAADGWPDNHSYENFVAWCWLAGEDRVVIVVNWSAQRSQARVQLPWPELAQQHWVFEDLATGAVYEYSGDELLNMGLYVELPAWGYHFFAVR